MIGISVGCRDCNWRMIGVMEEPASDAMQNLAEFRDAQKEHIDTHPDHHLTEVRMSDDDIVKRVNELHKLYMNLREIVWQIVQKPNFKHLKKQLEREHAD